MNFKTKRMVLIGVAIGFVGLAVSFVTIAFNDTVVFFFSPTELAEKSVEPDRRIRVGGLVEDGSVVKGGDNGEVSFRVTDGTTSLTIHYVGILPDLFREGQGIVAQGRLINATFEADEVLAKHDETYLPPEVAEALKQQGHWKEGADGGGPKPGLTSPGVQQGSGS